MTPGSRIYFPETGEDITDLVIEELIEQAQLENPVILERQQAEIAAASGQVARDLCCGRLVAEIDLGAYQEWELKMGREFFSKKKGGDGIEYLTKHFPATRVKSVSPHVKVHVNRSPVAPRRGVRGKRGRWAA